MISSAKKSFIWLWMAALLSASFGMSVQQVYCYCTGKTTVSIFAAAEACHAEKTVADKPDCCKKKAAPAPKSCCHKPDTQKRGCTKKTTQFVQLHTEFEVGSPDFKKLDAPKFWAISPAFPSSYSFSPAVQKTERANFDRPPPLLSGRMLCVRYGVYRC